MSDQAKQRYGLMAEFETPGQLMHAAQRVRDEGYKRWDCYSPFPVHGLDRAMGLRDTRLPWVVLGAAITGTSVALLMQWWMNAHDYRLIIAGKPFFSLPANIPVAFELTILFSAVTAFVCMFLFNGLPQFFHPTFTSRAFKRVTRDRFFLAVESDDPKFDATRTEAFLRSLDGLNVEWLEG